jgi:hypothetical protein
MEMRMLSPRGQRWLVESDPEATKKMSDQRRAIKKTTAVVAEILIGFAASTDLNDGRASRLKWWSVGFWEK